MDDLPPPLLIEILSRLNDSTDLARCRLISKTFDTLSREVRSINLVCTLSQYLKSRLPETRNLITPFKTILNNLVRNSSVVELISIGVAKPLGGISYDDIEDESDDLYLTDVTFVNQWLPSVCRELKSLSISDFWIQSCWRQSGILALLSSFCDGLLHLEVKNAWLSVDGMKSMPTLTNLTLESIRLDDEYLTKVNQCLPCLQVLNLIGVGGLKEPKIHLHHLRTCRWTVSNAPHSLAILAPNLVNLELNCIEPRSLFLETPLLTNFYLSLHRANKFEVKKLINLKILQLKSLNLYGLICEFPSDNSIKRLTVDSLKSSEPDGMKMLCMEMLFDAFPNVSSLSLLSGAWSLMETCFITGDLLSRVGMRKLEEIIAQLVIHDIEVTLCFISAILDKCPNLSDIGLLIHCNLDPNISSKLISLCRAEHPNIRWRWGMWKEGSKAVWISDGI